MQPISRLHKLAPAVFLMTILLIALVAAAPVTLWGQTAGEGSLQGTVTDPTGALVSSATVTVTNTATNIATVALSSSAGFFNISPLPPGTYTVRIVAKGFEALVQDNVVVDALQSRVFNPVLTVGSATQTVTVTGAPPVLDTADASLGMIVENETYTNLPLQMNGAQRDPTAFGVLTPGAQSANNGGRLPIVGGTGSYLGQLYLDGMPAETVSQQGDNRLVSLTVSVDSVDQFQMVTSTPPAEYMGAGAENFTMKSGGLQYHGQVSDFFRNTAFDNWSFTAKAATTKNSAGATVPAPKPIEHQDELSMSVGGVVPHTGRKLFFFTSYDKFHYRKGASYSLYTVPTPLMLAGNFTELNYALNPGSIGTGVTGQGANNPAILYDPTTNSCVASACQRSPIVSGGNNNVIPSGEISAIAKAMAKYVPAPTNPSVLTNNYLGGFPGGFDNHVNDWRVDYDVSAKQRISSLGAMGTENYVNNYGAGGSGATAYGFLPPPYIGGDLASVYPKDYVIGDTYTFSPNVVNQLKFSYTRFFQNIHDATAGNSSWAPTAFGITNLPAGQASQEFPGAQFTPTSYYSSALTGWTQNSNAAATQLTTPNNYAITDNVQWLKGKHSLTIGLAFQWEQINNANPATYTGVLDLTYNANSTANFGYNVTSGTYTNTLNTGGTLNPGSAPTTSNSAPTGFAFASYMLGAVGGSPSIGLQPVSEEGGRYKTIAPYVEDNYKLTPKLTVTLGLRWDYLPPYHEVKDHWTFLNPTMTNPLTGTPGLLQFAGSYGGSGVSCGCKTPVQTYYKYWGPRVGIAYSLNSKTVLRAGFAQVFSQAGGVGGRGGAFNGTGQTGFNTTAIGPAEGTTGNTAGPSFYLNSNSAYLGSNSNTALFGPTFAGYPAAPTPGVAAQELNTGDYINGSNAVVTPSSVSYADPYLSGRAPELEMFNMGFQRELTQNLTLAVNYMGNESHFIVNSGSTGSNARGLWTNQVNPAYLAALAPLSGTAGGPLLTSQATTANIAKVTAVLPNVPVPAFFAAAGNASNKVLIQQMLVAFPQYSGVSDTWGNVGNFTYGALQVTLEQRMSRGLTFNVNYTYGKNIGDDGTYRTGFDIPAAAISHGTQNWKQDRIDRSYTVISIPQILNAYGVYELPFGKGHVGNDSWLVRQLAGGWQFSSIFTFKSGTPLAPTWSGGSSVGQGQAMPDLNPAASPHSGRLNGSWGKGPNGYNTCNLGIGSGCTPIQYVNPTIFLTPQNVTTSSAAQYLIGNSPRTAPLGLRNPHSWNWDTGLRRTFPIHDRLAFQFEVDCLNTWNNVIFGSPSASWASGSTTFGTISGISNSPRDFQFAGHINF